MYPIEGKTCANCAHCSTYTVTVLGRNMHICAKSALDGDVEGTWTLVSLESNCTDYAGEWSPSADYIAELADTEALRCIDSKESIMNQHHARLRAVDSPRS